MAFDTVEELRLQLGERNSRYSSLEFVGAGAMGSVFKGFDERLRRTIALKVIHRALINTDLVYERFKREARLLSSISHKNVVHLFDFEDAGTLCFITEEYIDGFPLNVLLAEGKLKLAEIVSLVAALADGLQAVHDAGILHRDIKPNNIIVDERGEPHLLDFGLAQSFEGKGATALTKTGHVVGTLGFISPEVLLGETATKRSDVYQLGAVFYSALSGKAVYGRKAIAGLLKEGALDNPASLSQLGCVCDRQIEELVMSCVASEPEKRPLSAGEVRDSCTAWLKSLEETELLESQTLLIEPAGEADVSPSREFKKLPFLAFVISFLICIFYWYGSNEVFVIRDVEIKSGVTKVEVNWKTDKETAFVYEIHESKTRQLVAKGVESAATKEHNIKCSKLAPSTSYSMTLRWQGAYHQRAFRTEKVRFTKPIYTAFLGGVFFAEFSTNLDRSTKLELMSVTREQLAECRGEERVVIAGLGRLSDNSVNWQLKAGNRIIASGRTKAIQPQKPREWAAEQEPSCKPIWDGDLLYVADKRGFLTCYELARKPSSPKKNDTYGGLVRKWCFAPHSGPLARCATLYQLADGRLVLMLRNTNYGKWEIWCIDPVLRNKEWLERVGSLSSLPPWLHGNRDRWNKHLGPSEWCRVVEMPEGVSFAEELAVSDDLAVIQGIKKGPCWFAFSLSNGEKKWFLEAMEILPKKLKPVKAERQMLELDMGFSPVLKHGWGFFDGPYYP